MNLKQIKSISEIDGYINTANGVENDIATDDKQQQFSEREVKKPKKGKNGISSVIVWVIAIVIVFALFRFVKNNYTSILPDSAKNAPSSTTVNPVDEVEDTSNSGSGYGEGIAKQEKFVDSSRDSEEDESEGNGIDETENNISGVENKTSSENYLKETVSYDGWSVFTNYAYITSTYMDVFYVKIDCSICNTTGSVKTFNTSEFSLNNNGIIKGAVGLGSYEYTEIAPDASFRTNIEFLFPNNSNRVLDNMTMTIGDVSICLGYRPQAEEYRDKFFGVYIKGKGTGSETTMWVSPSDREGMYGITTYFYYDSSDQILISDEDDITLDENNIFQFSGLSYRWVPEEYSIYEVDSMSLTDEIKEGSKPFVKQ